MGKNDDRKTEPGRSHIVYDEEVSWFGPGPFQKIYRVIPEKIHTSPTDGKLEIQVGGGVERVWKSRWEGECKLESLSSGVNFVEFTR